MRKVLVTGASGFIGRHTIETLVSRGFEVHAVTSKSASVSASEDCHWHVADLVDMSAIRPLVKNIKPSHLLHLAWYAVPGKYWTALDNFLWVQASLELLRQFRDQGGERVVMAGTCAEYDWNYGYCSELVTPRHPNSSYGVCKNALQDMLAAYSSLTGLSSAWGRIFFLYGSYENPNRLVPSVIRSLLAGEKALCSHGNQIRDFLHVQDVANAFVAILDSQMSGAVNIGSGKLIQLKELIHKIAEKLGRPDLIELGAIIVSDKDPKLLAADVTRLFQEVDWIPKYDLDVGLETTISWWKDQISWRSA
jgi:nucleoside-diphosphate-sugar epimerase